MQGCCPTPSFLPTFDRLADLDLGVGLGAYFRLGLLDFRDDATGVDATERCVTASTGSKSKPERLERLERLEPASEAIAVRGGGSHFEERVCC